jgi:hypothetical protein
MARNGAMALPGTDRRSEDLMLDQPALQPGEDRAKQGKASSMKSVVGSRGTKMPMMPIPTSTSPSTSQPKRRAPVACGRFGTPTAWAEPAC